MASRDADHCNDCGQNTMTAHRSPRNDRKLDIHCRNCGSHGHIWQGAEPYFAFQQALDERTKQDHSRLENNLHQMTRETLLAEAKKNPSAFSKHYQTFEQYFTPTELEDLKHQYVQEEATNDHNGGVEGVTGKSGGDDLRLGREVKSSPSFYAWLGSPSAPM